MKKLSLPFFLFFSIAIITISCKKDNIIQNGEFTVDGEYYTLSEGFLSGLGENPNNDRTYNWNVYLTSNNVSISEFRITGKGELIQIDFNSSSEEGLVSGTYSWSDTREEFTIVPDTEIYLNHDFEGGNAGTKESATGGSADVTINGEDVKIEFTLVLSNGSTVSGNYLGPLQRI